MIGHFFPLFFVLKTIEYFAKGKIFLVLNKGVFRRRRGSVFTRQRESLLRVISFVKKAWWFEGAIHMGKQIQFQCFRRGRSWSSGKDVLFILNEVIYSEGFAPSKKGLRRLCRRRRSSSHKGALGDLRRRDCFKELFYDSLKEFFNRNVSSNKHCIAFETNVFKASIAFFQSLLRRNTTFGVWNSWKYLQIEK